MDIYTRRGDDGTTGLLHGGRVRKDSLVPDVLGAVDEAQAAIGVARAHAAGELADILQAAAADLWTVMAVIADTDPSRPTAPRTCLPSGFAGSNRRSMRRSPDSRCPTTSSSPGPR